MGAIADGMAPTASGTNPAGDGGPPKGVNISSDDLADQSPNRPRWMSLPNSRVIVNPFDVSSTLTEAANSDGPDLPLHAAYFAADRATPLRDLLVVHELPATAAPTTSPFVGFEDAFAGALDAAWTPSPSVTATASAGRLRLGVPSTGVAYGYVSRSITVDVDRAPLLRIDVPSVAEGTWALKVNDGTNVTDTIVQDTTAAEGTFFYDLPKLLAWHGTKTFTVRIFALGNSSSMAVEDIRMQAPTAAWLKEAATFPTTWTPHLQTVAATYADGTKVTGEDAFHDVDSLGRTLTITSQSASTAASFQLSGAYVGAPSYDAPTRVLTFTTTAFVGSVALPAGVGTPRFYADKPSLVGGVPVLATPLTSSGYWAVTLPKAAAGAVATARVGIGLAIASEAAGTSKTRALAAAAATNDAQKQAAYWSSVLQRAPAPIDFAIHAYAPSKPVLPADVRRLYYRAWAFIEADRLPPMPEVGFAHAQLATGKPSLYMHGAPGAKASASWDSTLGNQFLAYIEPDAAWDVLEGLMSLVPASGILPGEFLPAREAQTAFVLHAITGDTKRLGALYPALKRLLIYKTANPRYLLSAASTVKELPFLASALVDILYAEQIASLLGMTADAADWHARYTAALADMGTWFWATPTAAPVQSFDMATGSRVAGGVVSVTEALRLPDLTPDQITTLIARFDEIYDPALPLAGFGRGTIDVRHGITSYTNYGLLAHGAAARAQIFSNAVLAGQVEAGMLAERYQWDPQHPPFGSGERPTLFGAAAAIDAVLMNNGYRMDLGTPSFVMMPGAKGGVIGIAALGRHLDVHVDASAGAVTLSGSLLGSAAGCGTVALAPGKTATLESRCVVAP